VKTAFLILAGANLILMGTTAVFGLLVTPEGEVAFTRHFLLGLTTGLFTCFVHVVTFMYFVVCEKILRQSVLSDQLPVAHVEKAVRLKSRALRASMGGVGLILLTVMLGGAALARFDPIYHFVAAFATIFASLGLFGYQFVLIDESRTDFEAAFGENPGPTTRVGTHPEPPI